MTTLSDLIQERKRVLGCTYRALEARADSVITHQRWAQLGAGARIKEFPEPATLQVMADALEVDITEVVLAAARSVGLAVRAPSRVISVDAISVEHLRQRERDALSTIIEAMARSQHDGRGDA